MHCTSPNRGLPIARKNTANANAHSTFAGFVAGWISAASAGAALSSPTVTTLVLTPADSWVRGSTAAPTVNGARSELEPPATASHHGSTAYSGRARHRTAGTTRSAPTLPAAGTPAQVCSQELYGPSRRDPRRPATQTPAAIRRYPPPTNSSKCSQQDRACHHAPDVATTAGAAAAEPSAPAADPAPPSTSPSASAAGSTSLTMATLTFLRGSSDGTAREASGRFFATTVGAGRSNTENRSSMEKRRCKLQGTRR